MKVTLKTIAIIAIIAIVIGIGNVSSAFSFNANLSSNDKLVAGQEVKVTLTLSGIDMDDGIRSIKVKNIKVGNEFEAISATNFLGSGTWSPTYSNGGLVLMSGTPIKNDGATVILTLKVKNGITANSSTITFEDVVASSGSNTGDVSVGTKTITIKANESATSGNGGGTSGSQNGTSQTTNKNTSKDTTTTNTKTLPKTGLGQLGIILMVVLTAVGVFSYVLYKKTEKYVK